MAGALTGLGERSRRSPGRSSPTKIIVPRISLPETRVLCIPSPHLASSKAVEGNLPERSGALLDRPAVAWDSRALEAVGFRPVLA